MALAFNSTGFNPHRQKIVLYYPDGYNITFRVSVITQANREAALWTFTHSIQIGACAVLLVLLGLLTRAEKRRSPIFVCNVLSLVFVILRSATALEYYMGGFYDAYSYFAYDYSDLNPSSRYVSIASGVCALILRVVIQLSLILQLRIVFDSEPKRRDLLTALTSTVALLATALYFKVLVENSKSTMEPYVGIYVAGWTYPAAKATLAASISIFSAIFVFKLARAIRRRKDLGLKKFGALQIIFIFGCQTMILPAIFTIADSVATIEGLAYFTPFMAAVLLPLSGMWAAGHIDSQSPIHASGIHRFGDSAASRGSSSNPSPLMMQGASGAAERGFGKNLNSTSTSSSTSSTSGLGKW